LTSGVILSVSIRVAVHSVRGWPCWPIVGPSRPFGLGLRLRDRATGWWPALAALPEDQRTAIRLAYFAGKTYQQVAAALDLPEDTVKARMCSGLRRVASSVHVAVVEEER
jgi:Sigma-70, region 4